MRVLVLSPEIPFPPIGGAASRTFHLVEALASHHAVTLVGFDVSWGADGAETAPPAVDVVRVPRHGQRSPWLVDELGRSGSSAASRAMRSALLAISGKGFDAVLIEHSWMGQYLDAVAPEVPRILDLHNVHARMDPRLLESERAIAGSCDVCLTVSQEEAAAAKALLGVARPRVVPNTVDLRFFSPHPAASGSSVAFTGFLAYPPNIEGVRWFARAVWPLVREAIPEAVFDVVGAVPAEAVRALASADVVIHGFVPDVRPHLHRAAVVVVPLHAGGGTRVKILEAAACARAIVSTSIGSRGLRFHAGRDLLIADEPEEFAQAVIDLLRSRARRQALGRSAREAARPYGLAEVQPRFRALVEEVIRGGPVTRRPAAAPPPRRAWRDPW